jgi:hypothetical protein
MYESRKVCDSIFLASKGKALYEAAFGSDSENIPDIWKSEAEDYKKTFVIQTQNVANLDRAAVAENVSFLDSWSYYAGWDHINAPADIANIFAEAFQHTPYSFYGLEYVASPALKFSFDPPQLHVIRDLPTEEWYNYDWIASLDNSISRVDNKVIKKALESVRENLIKVLPPEPSPKNEKEAFFWQELRRTGLSPMTYYLYAMREDKDKKEQELLEIYGKDYTIFSVNDHEGFLYNSKLNQSIEYRSLFRNLNTINELGLGTHWQSKNADLSVTENETYLNLVKKIKTHPDYEKAFDETLSYDEREAIRMTLDKLMRQYLDESWQAYLRETKMLIASKGLLQTLLQTINQS